MASTAPPPPLAGAKLAVIAFALAVGTFMQVLDATIANVSLPTIAGNLGVAPDESTWVITAFAVAQGISVPLTGALMVRYGVVRVFVWSVLLFTLASFLCGIAWSLSSLVIFRVIQGAVSGPMMPGSQALLISIFPPHKRSAALGIWSMTTLVGPIMGPLLGGYISDNLHWSWIFLINVPVGLACAAVSWRGLRDRETPTRRLPVDGIGFALLVVWVGSLQIMLDLGKNADWFHATHIVVLALVAAVSFVAWLIWELTEANPAVDLTLYRNRNFAIGGLVFCLGYAVFFANILLFPLWLQTQMGYTATLAGLVAAPSGVVAVLLTPLVARLSGKIDTRLIATVAFLAFMSSYYLRSQFTTSASLWVFTFPSLIQGIGMSCFFLGMLTISLDRIPPEKLPSATGVSNFSRIIAGSFAASITTTLWDRREALHQGRLAEAVGREPPVQAAIEALQGLGLSTAQATAAVYRQFVNQSYLLATTDLFWLSAVLAGALILLLWTTRRPQPQGGPVAAD